MLDLNESSKLFGAILVLHNLRHLITYVVNTYKSAVLGAYRAKWFTIVILWVLLQKAFI